MIGSNIKINKKSSLFIVQIFKGTSYFFKSSETKVNIFPFKTNDIKMKTILSLKVTIIVTIP